MKEGLVVDVEMIELGDFKLGPISFTVPSGSVMGLIGPNGAGKTSITDLITRQIATGKKDISFNGIDDYREDMAFIFDRIPFSKHSSVKKINRIYADAYINWNQEEFEVYCNKYKLSPKEKIKHMSLGKQQRLMQALALSHKAKLFVFDEPNDGIDPFIRTSLLNDLRNRIYEDEATVVISSHNVSELEEIVDYVTYVEEGKILFSLDIESLRDQAITLLESNGVKDLQRYISDPSLNTFTALMQTRRGL